MIFKREKELARKLEFDGLYITDQPEDDDIKGQWDRLVLNTPCVGGWAWRAGLGRAMRGWAMRGGLGLGASGSPGPGEAPSLSVSGPP